LFRTIFIGVLALGAVVAVLGLVFAVGALRIKLADNGSADAVALPASTAPASQPAAGVTVARSDPKPDIPALSAQSIELPAEKATLSPGLTLQADVVPRQPKRRKKHEWDADPEDDAPIARQAITGWHGTDGFAEWTIKIPKSNTYEVDAVYAGGAIGKELKYIVTVGDTKLEGGEPLPIHGHSQTYKMTTVGNADLPAGEIKVRFQLDSESHGSMLRLRSIRLIPAS
jgi:hypothetical protein